MLRRGKIFLMIFFVSQISPLVSIQTCNANKEDTMICKNKIPATLPKGVTRVFLELRNSFDMESDAFSHQSWQNATVLDITAEYTDYNGYFTFEIEEFNFRYLDGLEELRFHGNYIRYFGPNTFQNISHLAVLELSECPSLKTKTLFESLLNADITIDKFYLNSIGTGSGQYCVLDEIFHEVVQKKQIKALSLRKSVLKLKENIIFTPLQHLKEGDISQIMVYISSPTTYAFDMYLPFLESLSALNASSIPVDMAVPDPNFLLNKIIKSCSELNHRLIEGFIKIENLYLNKIFRKSANITMDNTLLNISDCKFNLKRWHFKENQVRYVNITVYLPLNNTLKELDFSDNIVEYFSPQVFQSTKSLEVLKLTNNKLFNMQTLSEFRDLLVSLTKLKRFHLARNELSLLPQDIFRNNEHLQVLDLSENKLKTVAFTLKHMKSLQLLNLGGNHIKYLGDLTLADFQRFYEEMTFKEENQTLIIEMSGNPFECSCESVPFMQWIIRQGISSEKYLCKIENEETEIDDDSLQDAKFLCYRTIIIVGTSSSIVFLSVVCVLVTIFVLRRKRRQTRECIRIAFLNDYLNGGLKEKYLCAISFASEDEMCVLNTIYVEFTNALTKILGTKHDFICMGDKHFCLGRPIVNEILRCTSESCVLIFVISESFCKSRWCELELREAYENGKPIILILKEEVEESKMSTLLLTIFNKFTRAKLVEKDGVYTLNTEWENLGESIIKLASEAYAKK